MIDKLSDPEQPIRCPGWSHLLLTMWGSPEVAYALILEKHRTRGVQPIVDYNVIALVTYLTALPGFIKATKGLI